MPRNLLAIALIAALSTQACTIAIPVIGGVAARSERSSKKLAAENAALAEQGLPTVTVRASTGQNIVIGLGLDLLVVGLVGYSLRDANFGGCGGGCHTGQ